MNIIFYIALFLYIFTLSVYANIVDFDLWARIIVGKTFFQTGELLNFDFQSFGPTRQWFDHEWGSSLIFYQILDKFGDSGLIIAKSIIIFLIYFIITRIILLRRKHLGDNKSSFKTASFNILFFILFLQATVDVVFSTIRCQTLSFLFFVIWFYTLERTRLEKNYRLLYLLPLTMIIWANLHGGCFTGLGLLFIYIIGEFLNKKAYKPYIITFILSILAMFINPYGIKYVIFLFYAVTLKRPTITEWASIFHPVHLLKFLKFKFWLLFISIISSIILTNKYKRIAGDDFKDKIIVIYNNLDKTKALTLIIMLILSVKTLRIMPFFALTSVAFLYDDIYKIFNKKLPNTINNAKEIFLLGLITISFMFTIKTNQIHTTVKSYPYVEAEYLKINNLKGNLVANFHYGSYLGYKLYPDNFIFMDGRYEETYEPNLLSRLEAMHIGDNWKEEINKQHIDYIIMEKEFANNLINDKDWTPVIASKRFILFVNKNIKIKNPKIPSSDLKHYNETKWETNINWGLDEK